MALNFGKVAYSRSAGTPADFLRDGLPQFAFAGRSNVGKSSVINRLVNRKNLAYVGASPGKTTQINYFLVDDRAYLVDLPGYGYAKVSQAEKERWARLMETYFQDGADAITAGVLIVDIRHKPTENDRVMHSWFRESGCPAGSGCCSSPQSRRRWRSAPRRGRPASQGRRRGSSRRAGAVRLRRPRRQPWCR